MSSPRNGFGLGEAQRQIREKIRERELIDSAIDLARTDDAAWRHLRTLLVDWVREDEAKRRELLRELTALGKGRRGNAKTDAVEDGMLVGLVDILTAQGTKRMTQKDALLMVMKMVPGVFPEDLQSLSNRYTKVRKRPEVRRIAGLK